MCGELAAEAFLGGDWGPPDTPPPPVTLDGADAELAAAHPGPARCGQGGRRAEQRSREHWPVCAWEWSDLTLPGVTLLAGILPRSWSHYTVPAGMTVIQWVSDFSERVKQLQNISQAAASGGAKELKVVKAAPREPGGGVAAVRAGEGRHPGAQGTSPDPT